MCIRDSTHAELIHIALLGGRAFKLSLVFSIDAYLMIVAITTTLSFDATAKRVWDLLTLRGNSACAGESRDECECQPNLCTEHTASSAPIVWASFVGGQSKQMSRQPRMITLHLAGFRFAWAK